VANIKWGITLGAIAAIISMILGVISGVVITYILVRAIVFLFVFFALGSGARVVLNSFLPELMYIDDEPDSKLNLDPEPPPSSQINITLGGMGDYAVPEMYRNSEDSQELGNIEDLISGNFKIRSTVNSEDDADFAPRERGSEGIDQNGQDDYNIKRDSFSSMPQEFVSFQGSEPEPEPEASKPEEFEKPAFTPVFGSDSDDLETLPDLGAMANVFSTGFDDDIETTIMPQVGGIEGIEGDEAESSQTQYNKGNKSQQLEGDFNPQELAQGIRTVLSKDQGR